MIRSLIALLCTFFFIAPAIASETWFLDEQVSSGGSCDVSNHSIAVDHRGWVHMTWFVTSSQGDSVYYRCIQDTVIAPVVNLGPGRDPKIAVDHTGTPHVVWVYRDIPNGDDVIYATADSSGWNAEAVYLDDVEAQLPVVAVDAFGTRQVAWRQLTEFGYKVLLSENTGSGWSEPVLPYPTGPNQTQPRLVSDGLGRLHLAWSEQSVVAYGYRDAFGWSDRVYPAGTTDAHFDMTVDSGGAVHFVYVIPRSGSGTDIAYVSFDGKNWSSQIKLTDTAGGKSHATIVADLLGNLRVVWSDTTFGPSEILYLQRTGDTWGDATRLTVAGSSTDPCVGVGPDLRPHVLWRDDRTGTWQIWYKTSDDIDPPVIEMMEPVRGPKGVHVPIVLTGSSFVRPVSVALGYQNVTIDGVWSNRIEATVDLAGGEPGIYDVMVTNPDGQTSVLPLAFEAYEVFWSEPDPIFESIATAEEPDIAVDSMNRVHAVWRGWRDGTADIYYATRDGDTWSAPVTLAGTESSWEPSIALDANDDVHLLWRDSRTGPSYIFHRLLVDGVWTEPDTLSNVDARNQCVAADDGGGIHVAWAEDVGGGGADVIYRQWHQGTWSEREVVTADAFSYADNPYLAVASTGLAHLTWSDSRSGSTEIYYASRSDDWSVAERLSYSSVNSVHPAVAMDAYGEPIVVWTDQISSVDLYSSVRRNGFWSVPQQITNAQSESDRACLTRDPFGIVHLCWQDFRESGHSHVYHETWDGTGWSPELRVSVSGYQERTPRLVADHTGKLHLVLQGIDEEQSIAYLTRLPLYVPEPPAVSSVLPSEVENFGTQVVTILGSNFQPPLEVSIVGDGGELAHTQTLATATQIDLLFDLTRVPVGSWSVVVTNYDGQVDTLEAGLETTQSPWSDEVHLTDDPALSSLGYNAAKAIARDHMGGLHCFWYDSRDGNQEIYWSESPSGIGWGPPTRLTIAPGISAYPATAATDDRVAVAWHDARSGVATIYVKERAGIVWSADQQLTTGPAPALHPSIAAADGRFHLVWQDGRDGNWEIYYAERSSEWTAPVRLTVNNASSLHPCILAREDGTLWVVWMDDRDGNWEVYSKRFDGSSWSEDERVTTDAADSFYPTLAATGSDVHVVWQDYRDGDWNIYRRRLNVAESTIQVTNDPSSSQHPTAAGTPDGTLHLMWSDDRFGTPQILYESVGPGGSSLTHRVTSSWNEATLPSLIAGQNGDLDLVWRDSRDGNREIYHLGRRPTVEPSVVAQESLELVLGARVQPNPVRGHAAFHLSAPASGPATFWLVDAAGRRVRRLLDGQLMVGQTLLSWDGKDDWGNEVPSGVYFYRLKVAGSEVGGRVIRVR